MVTMSIGMTSSNPSLPLNSSNDMPRPKIRSRKGFGATGVSLLLLLGVLIKNLSKTEITAIVPCPTLPFIVWFGRTFHASKFKERKRGEGRSHLLK